MGDRLLAGVETGREFLVRTLLLEVVAGAQLGQLAEGVGVAGVPMHGLRAPAVAVCSPLLRLHGELGCVR